MAEPFEPPVEPVARLGLGQELIRDVAMPIIAMLLMDGLSSFFPQIYIIVLVAGTVNLLWKLISFGAFTIRGVSTMQRPQEMSEDERRRFEAALEGIRANSTTKARFSYLRLGPEEVQELAAALAGNRHVTTLLIEGHGIGPCEVRVLAPALVDSSVSTLQLFLNNVGTEGAKMLAAVLKDTPLTCLILSDNGIGDEGLRALVASIPGSSLKHLEIRRNNITAEGVKAFAAMRGSCVEEIGFSGNDIGDEGAVVLASCLKHMPLKLLGLNTARIGLQGVKALAVAIRESVVDKLVLTNNDIDEKGYQALLAAVKDSGITSLELHGPSSAETISQIHAELEAKKYRSLVLQMEVKGDELTFRTMAGEVCAVLNWNSEQRVQDLPEAVFTQMRAARLSLSFKHRARNLKIVRPDGNILQMDADAVPLLLQLQQ